MQTSPYLLLHSLLAILETLQKYCLSYHLRVVCCISFWFHCLLICFLLKERKICLILFILHKYVKKHGMGHRPTMNGCTSPAICTIAVCMLINQVVQFDDVTLIYKTILYIIVYCLFTFKRNQLIGK